MSDVKIIPTFAESYASFDKSIASKLSKEEKLEFL